MGKMLGKNAWDGSSIEEIAAIFDNTQEEIEDLKCDAVLKLTKMFLTNMHENNEDGEVEYDLTFPTDPNFPSENQTSPYPPKTSILDFLDFILILNFLPQTDLSDRPSLS